VRRQEGQYTQERETVDIVITLRHASHIATRYLPHVDAGQGVPVGWVEMWDPQHCLTIHAADAGGFSYSSRPWKTSSNATKTTPRWAIGLAVVVAWSLLGR
jgi:hypothetical protein